jgi:DNA-binding MarR family transcriptional regulator
MTETAAQAARELRVLVSRLRRRLREVAVVGDLTAPQLSVLEGIRPQSMAATLAALDQRGLIRREPDPADGRRQLVSLTDAGREHLEGNRLAREEWLACALRDRYTEDERTTIVEALALLERLTRP